MPKTNYPADFCQSRLVAHKFGSIAGNHNSSAGDDSASPAEGAALIRAFLQIEQREIRTAIIELVTRLSAASPRS